MKRPFFLALFALCLLPQSVFAFSGGSGTSGDPWQIATVADLVEVADYLGSDDTDKYFVLTADIDLDVAPYNTGDGWTPIGDNTNIFYGQFDGGGYTISNLYASTTDDYVGLFGRAFNATFDNITIANARVIGGAQVGVLLGQGGTVTTTDIIVGGAVTSTGNYIGGMVGRISGAISSVTSSVRVYHDTSSTRNAGGVLGYMDSGSIFHAVATGDVSGYQRVGGVAGTLSGSVTTVSSSYATGNIFSSGGGVGGFVGNLYNVDIYDSYATGNVSSTGSTVGGFYGFGQGEKSLYRIYATGNVEGTSSCGGLGGYSENLGGAGVLIQDSYARGDITCGSTVGGITGYAHTVTLTRVYYAGVLPSSGSNRGGLAGSGGTSYTVNDSYWDTEVSGLSTTLDDKGTGTSTVAMKTQGTYTDWDFDDVWVISAGNNDGYPYLAYQSFDTTNPTATILFPADGATTVTSSANLSITFDETVTVQTGNIVIYSGADDTVFETIDITSGKVTGSGTSQLVIDPSGTFTSEAAYYVLIDATAIDDSSGNSFAGISDSSVWNFTIADETNPTLSTVSPADGSTDVSVSASLVMTFSEAVDAESGNVVIYNASDDSVFETIAVTGGSVSGSGSATITISPSSNFSNSADYYIFIDGTAFDDAAGNSFAGITSSSTWNFTTVAAPVQSSGGGVRAIAPPASVWSGGVPNSQENDGTYGLNPVIVPGSPYMVQSNADPRIVTHIAVSVDDPQFTKISFQEYKEVVPVQIPPDGGDHTVYIRYLSRTGHVSMDFERVVTYSADSLGVSQTAGDAVAPAGDAPTPQTQGTVSVPGLVPLSRSLERGMVGEDVRTLQIILNRLGFIVDTSGVGSPGNESTYFGSLTYGAVIRFQDAYAQAILIPIGLSAPTGYVGPRTIAQIERLTQ